MSVNLIGNTMGLLSSIFSFASAKSANRDNYQNNLKLQHDSQNWSSAENAKARNFANQMFWKEARLMNSAHQREASDLKKAGFNPILTTGMSGAQTPTASASMVGAGTNSYNGNINEGQQVIDNLNTAKQLKQTDESISNEAKKIKNDFEIQNNQYKLASKRLESDIATSNANIELQRQKLAQEFALQSQANRINMINATTSARKAEIDARRLEQEKTEYNESAQHYSHRWTSHHPKQASFSHGLHRWLNGVSVPLIYNSKTTNVGGRK